MLDNDIVKVFECITNCHNDIAQYKSCFLDILDVAMGVRIAWFGVPQFVVPTSSLVFMAKNIKNVTTPNTMPKIKVAITNMSLVIGYIETL